MTFARTPAAAAVAGCALLLVAGCTSAPQEPGTNAPKDLEPSPVKKIDKDKQSAEATITRYNQAVKVSLSPGATQVPIRRIRAVVAEPYATRLGKRLAVEQSQGLVMRGRDVYRTRTVKVRGDSATVVSCWDPSQGDVVNTFAKPEEKVTPAKANLTTFRLTRASGGWKITSRTPGKPC